MPHLAALLAKRDLDASISRERLVMLQGQCLLLTGKKDEAKTLFVAEIANLKADRIPDGGAGRDLRRQLRQVGMEGRAGMECEAAGRETGRRAGRPRPLPAGLRPLSAEEHRSRDRLARQDRRAQGRPALENPRRLPARRVLQPAQAIRQGGSRLRRRPARSARARTRPSAATGSG